VQIDKNDYFTVFNNSIIKIKNSLLESSLNIAITKNKDDKTPAYLGQLVLQNILIQQNECIINIGGNNQNNIIGYCEVVFNHTSSPPSKISFKNCNINQLKITTPSNTDTFSMEMDNGKIIQECTILQSNFVGQQKIVFSEIYNIKKLNLHIQCPYIIPDILKTINKDTLEELNINVSNSKYLNVDLGIDLAKFLHLKTVKISNHKSDKGIEKYTVTLPGYVKSLNLCDRSNGKALWTIKNNTQLLTLDSYKISINKETSVKINENVKAKTVRYNIYDKDTFDYLKKTFSSDLKKGNFLFYYKEDNLDFSDFNNLQYLRLSNHTKQLCKIVPPKSLKKLELWSNHFNEIIDHTNNLENVYVYHNESDKILINCIQDFINCLNKQTIKEIYLKLSSINKENDQVIDFEGFNYLEKITIYTYRETNNIEVKNVLPSCDVEIINKIKMTPKSKDLNQSNSDKNINQENENNQVLQHITEITKIDKKKDFINSHKKNSKIVVDKILKCSIITAFLLSILCQSHSFSSFFTTIKNYFLNKKTHIIKQ
jgi:hypothetical protein